MLPIRLIHRRERRGRRGRSAFVATIMVVVAGGACTDRPVRLVVSETDTLVVNAVGAAQLSAQLLSAAGEVIEGPATFGKVSGDSLVLTADGQVTCPATGNALLRVSAAGLANEFAVLCRPVKALHITPGLRLEVGGPPVEPMLSGVSIDGKPVDRFAIRAASRDSTVAVFDGGLVHPRSRGHTNVDVDLGECATVIPVDVLEIITATDSILPFQEFVARDLYLVQGEMRTWRIPEGRYELQLLTAPRDSASLLLAAHPANCAPFPGIQHYSCVIKGGSAVVVRNMGARKSPARGTVRIRRLADTPPMEGREVQGAGWWRDSRNPRGSVCVTIMGR